MRNYLTFIAVVTSLTSGYMATLQAVKKSDEKKVNTYYLCVLCSQKNSRFLKVSSQGYVGMYRSKNSFTTNSRLIHPHEYNTNRQQVLNGFCLLNLKSTDDIGLAIRTIKDQLKTGKTLNDIADDNKSLDLMPDGQSPKKKHRIEQSKTDITAITTSLTSSASNNTCGCFFEEQANTVWDENSNDNAFVPNALESSSESISSLPTTAQIKNSKIYYICGVKSCCERKNFLSPIALSHIGVFINDWSYITHFRITHIPQYKKIMNQYRKRERKIAILGKSFQLHSTENDLENELISIKEQLQDKKSLKDIFDKTSPTKRKIKALEEASTDSREEMEIEGFTIVASHQRVN